MNERKSQYWVWKNTIIDFDNLSNEKNEYGGYITKKDLIFSQLGTPDKEIHEWYNGKYSSEYNEAYKYAYELNLIEHYRDYEDEIDKLQSNWNSLKEWLEKQKEDSKICKEWNNKKGFNDIDYERDIKRFDFVLDKMNELEGKDEECF